MRVSDVSEEKIVFSTYLKTRMFDFARSRNFFKQNSNVYVKTKPFAKLFRTVNQEQWGFYELKKFYKFFWTKLLNETSKLVTNRISGGAKSLALQTRAHPKGLSNTVCSHCKPVRT